MRKLVFQVSKIFLTKVGTIAKILRPRRARYVDSMRPFLYLIKNPACRRMCKNIFYYMNSLFFQNGLFCTLKKIQRVVECVKKFFTTGTVFFQIVL